MGFWSYTAYGNQNVPAYEVVVWNLCADLHGTGVNEVEEDGEDTALHLGQQDGHLAQVVGLAGEQLWQEGGDGGQHQPAHRQQYRMLVVFATER